MLVDNPQDIMVVDKQKKNKREVVDITFPSDGNCCASKKISEKLAGSVKSDEKGSRNESLTFKSSSLLK